MNKHRYVHSAERRFYGPHWIQFCDTIKVSPQEYGAFDKDGYMLGLTLPCSQFNADKISQMVRSLRLIYSDRENGVDMQCYLMGTRYYKFVFFEETVAISEDDYENVRRRTIQS